LATAATAAAGEDSINPDKQDRFKNAMQKKSNTAGISSQITCLEVMVHLTARQNSRP
jgi:hypothetical protein